jgi:hypothetical protein
MWWEVGEQRSLRGLRAGLLRELGLGKYEDAELEIDAVSREFSVRVVVARYIAPEHQEIATVWLREHYRPEARLTVHERLAHGF